MEQAAKNADPAYGWLTRPDLELQVIVNLASGVLAEAPIADDQRHIFRRFLKAAIDTGELPAIKRDNHANKHSLIRLAALQNFAKRAGEYEKLLRDFCERWAAIRAAVMTEVELSHVKWLGDWQKQHPNEKRPETRAAMKAEFPDITERQMRTAIKKAFNRSPGRPAKAAG